MKKRLLASLLCGVMMTGTLPTAFAADLTVEESPIYLLDGEGTDAEATTLQAKIDAATNGETVTLTANTTESVTISANKNITLNIPEGVTLTNAAGSDTITVALGATLTITGSGTVDNVSHQKAAVANNGTANLNGCSFTRSQENGKNANNSGGNSFYNLLNHGIMNIDGATVSQNGGFSSMIENGYQDYTSTFERKGYKEGTNHANPSLTINSGSFSGGLNTVKNDDGGSLTINGGTFENVKQAVVLNWNVAAIDGGSFTLLPGGEAVILNGGGNESLDKGELTINGGTFEGNNAPVLAAMYSNSDYLSKDKIAISGGTFSSDVSDYIAGNAGTITDSNGNKVVVDHTNHVWNNGTVTKQPTCTTEGEKTYTCTVDGCNKTKTDPIPATGHNWSGGSVTKQPTCTTEGVKTSTCKNCGMTVTSTIPATGHVEETIPAVAPTCTTDGKTEGKKCTVCGKITQAQKNVGMLGHTSVVDKKVKATTKKNGKTTGWHCDTCGEVLVKQKTIRKASNITLSKTSYKYNGKKRTPKVIARDSKDNKIPSKYYTVKYASGRTKVGTYKVTVTFKGSKYTGKKTLTFRIKK